MDLDCVSGKTYAPISSRNPNIVAAQISKSTLLIRLVFDWARAQMSEIRHVSRAADILTDGFLFFREFKKHE
jgi:hypothetical protein